MTEGEKKAIEVLEKYKFSEREEYLENNAKKIGKKYEDLYLERTWIPTTYERKQFTIVYNLIEKLQKEIEEKTTIIMAGAEKVKQLEKEFIIKQEVKENYIPKNKIREIIEELEKQEDWYIENKSLDDLYGKIDILKELLEEEYNI